MATYKVGTDGKAPSYARSGDLIVTGGGTYKINSEGKGEMYDAKTNTSNYNGSYDSHPSDNNYLSNYTNQAKYLNTDSVNNYYQAYLDNAYSKLASDYQTKLNAIQQNLNNAYADSKANVTNINNAYRNNMQDLYDSTYNNNTALLQQAANRGMTSGAQGLAMTTAGLMSASENASQLAKDRDDNVSNINVQLAAQKANLASESLQALQDYLNGQNEALSTAELNKLDRLLSIEESNANTYNSYLQSALGNQYNWNSMLNEQDWQANQNQLDRDAAMEQLLYQLSNQRSYGGYSGYGGGSGYSAKYGDTSSGTVNQSNVDWLIKVADTGKYSDNQLNQVAALLEQGYNPGDSKISSILSSGIVKGKKMNTTNVSNEKFLNTGNQSSTINKTVSGLGALKNLWKIL